MSDGLMFDERAHVVAAKAARDAYGEGKQAVGSAEGYRRADWTYKEVYEREAGRPFRWFEGFPGIWAAVDRNGHRDGGGQAT
jgi:hypothetical protein